MRELKLLQTGIPNLDAVLGGGFPVYSLNILAGQPGTGKTIMAQQLMFAHIRCNPTAKALYLTTLSEPTIKVMRYMQHFSFFDESVFGDQVLYQDIGRFIRENPLEQVLEFILDLVEQHGPDILVIDSFKAVRDLIQDVAKFRRFCFDLSVRLAGARCTTFLVGEYGDADLEEGAEFAVADGIVQLELGQQNGDQSRCLRVVKLRGQATQMEAYPFAISENGMRVLSSALTLRNHVTADHGSSERLSSGIPGLDELLRGGFQRDRAILLAGVSGTGKTTFALQYVVKGAELGEKGLLVSFEETPERLIRMAAGFGWDLLSLQEKGLVRIVFVPQTEIRLEENLELIVREVLDFRPCRLAVDSLSVLLHKVKEPAVQRARTSELAMLVQKTGVTGIFICDVPADGSRLSRFGVEETATDGTIVLSTEIEGTRRRRFLEVLKMRGSDHVSTRQRMEITSRGIDLFHVAMPELEFSSERPRLAFEPLNGIVRGTMSHGSAWLVRGDPGLGKSTLAYQFCMEGLRRKESVLHIAADAPGYQVRQSLQNFGFLPDPYVDSGQLVIMDAFGGGRRAVDLSDPEAFLFAVARQVERMSKPLRMVFDSLTPLALGYSPKEFVMLVHRKNHLLRHPEVTLFDTLIGQMLSTSDLYSLLNAYDVVLDLYTPDWGDMKLSGNSGYRTLHVRKVRGVTADPRPFPYVISQDEGLVVIKDFYARVGVGGLSKME